MANTAPNDSRNRPESGAWQGMSSPVSDPDAAVAIMTDILLFGIATPAFVQQHRPTPDLPTDEPDTLPPRKGLKIVS